MAFGKVEIVFKGASLGILEGAGKFWVLNPGDGCHNSAFEYKKDGDSDWTPGGSLAGQGHKVEILRKDKNTGSELPGLGTFPTGQFVGLSKGYAHGRKMKAKDLRDIYGLRVRINAGEFAGREQLPAAFKYAMVKLIATRKKGKVTELVSDFWTGLKVTIEMRHIRQHVLLSVNDGGPIEFNYDVDAVHRIEFDNDCEPGYNDFENFYKVVKKDPENGGEKRFSLEWIPNEVSHKYTTTKPPFNISDLRADQDEWRPHYAALRATDKDSFVATDKTYPCFFIYGGP